MDKHINRFFTTLNDFLFELEENFPNIKELIQKYSIRIDFKEEKDKIKFIVLFYNEIKEYNDNIKNNDGAIFNTDKEVNLLPNIDFKKIWNVSYKSEEDKITIWNSIWNFFKILYILADLINSLATKNIEEKPDNDITDMITNLKNNDNSSTKFDMSQLGDAKDAVKNMFSGDNVMSELINDITKEVSTELGDMDTSNIFELLGKNSDKLQTIIGNVSKSIDSKVSTGEINENELLKSAKSMENIVNQNNPLMDMVRNMKQSDNNGGPDLAGMMNMINNLNLNQK
jgi:hypothetical protein